MPTYENKCLQCGHEFENEQKITDNSRPACPKCGAPTERLISRSSFLLLGTGWSNSGYATTSTSRPKR